MRETENQQDSKSRFPLYLSIGLIGGLVACYFLVPSIQQFFDEAWKVLTSNDKKRIEGWVSGFGWLGPIVLILAMIGQMFLLVIPTLLLMVVCILAYGPFLGSLLILVSVVAASSVGYFIGIHLGETLVVKLMGQKNKYKIEKFIDTYGFWAVIVTRLNPFLSNDAISFVGGILRMGYWKFIGATLIGILPLTVFIAILGKSTETLKTGLLWGSLVSLLAFGIYVWSDKSKKMNYC
ncbi:TVP38/TMEM64 family protein [Gillisia hiemivivida]|uniref:TVP38/TMEM64 family membrane protein n=1 Tax=Gillisia hiemivivida TaxID=291190 RepID=A0A5C6ZVR3_9FLAO|nr:TVP38/TMEM64 family protein [Gillisia hiemivivida]TXD94789.1 TVP38/TMEM64 family protein [Gillisia hiemivivida]